MPISLERKWYDYQMQLHYEISGSGTDLVLLSGVGGSTRYWAHLVAGFESSGYRVIRIDMLGFGRSPRLHHGQYDLKAHTKAVVATCNTIGVKNAVIVGFSMSCSAALHVAASAPEYCERIVLLCPAFYSSSHKAVEMTSHSETLPRWLLESRYAPLLCKIICNNKYIAIPVYRTLGKNLPLDVRDDARLHHWKSYRESFTHLTIDYRATTDLVTAQCPVQVVYGLHDRYLETTFIQSWPKLNPNIDLECIPEGRHQLPHQKPDIVLASIIRSKLVT